MQESRRVLSSLYGDRLLAILGFSAGCCSLLLLFSGAGRAPARAGAQPTAFSVPEVVSEETGGFTQAWARLRVDLRLDETQGQELAQVLSDCARSVQAAGQHPDPLWRDRLLRRAHRDAFVLASSILSKEQYDDFLVWLEAPTHRDLAAWFQRPEGCKGCGGKK
jgi:hypothetical protein